MGLTQQADMIDRHITTSASSSHMHITCKCGWAGYGYDDYQVHLIAALAAEGL